MIKTVWDLEVYKLSYEVAMKIFQVSKSFPKEKKYSLTDQIVRSSRSVVANIAEGWGKRTYELDFKKFLIYASGSIEETKAWILFAKDCGYIDETVFNNIIHDLATIGAKIFKLYDTWKSF